MKNVIQLIGLVMILIFIGFDIMLVSLLSYFVANKFIVEKNIKKEIVKKEKIKNDFNIYIKKVVLLTYTRPLKVAFKNVKCETPELQFIIDNFNEKVKYDFSIEPFKNLALEINADKRKTNYELNIMYLLYEMEKKGLGKKFISDVLVEINLLNENKVEEKINKLKEDAQLYALPPTIINFIYLTLILFNLIDKMILSVL